MPTKKTKARKYINPDDFYIARRRAGLDLKQAAEMLDVDIKTVRNWESNKSPIPYAAFRLMRMAGGYSLLGEGWEGWAIWQDKLYSPSGRSFAPYELHYVGNYIQMARKFIENKKTAKQVASADHQAQINLHLMTAPATKLIALERSQVNNSSKLDNKQPSHATNVIHINFNRKKEVIL